MTRIPVAIALCFLSASAAFAHGGEDHASAPGTDSGAAVSSGQVEVSEVAQRNLGLTVAEAELTAVETTLRLIGEIQADPTRSAAVSSRIPGRVTAIFAKEGEHVRKGQPLVEVESLQLGDPPPRVRYGSRVGGIVTDRHVVVGDDVAPNRHLFEVADLSEVLAVGRVFEGQIGKVAVGQRARVRVPSYPGRVFDGVVERVGGRLDPGSRSLAVYIRVANPDTALRPHMRATASLVTGGAAFAIAIPKRAVLGEAGNVYAFVQDDSRSDRFERRPLVTGVSNDRLIEVVEGLSPGDRVVVEGAYSLQYLTPVAAEEEADAHAEGSASEPGAGGARATVDAPSWTFIGSAGLGALILAAGALYLLRKRARAASGER